MLAIAFTIEKKSRDKTRETGSNKMPGFAIARPQYVKIIVDICEKMKLTKGREKADRPSMENSRK